MQHRIGMICVTSGVPAKSRSFCGRRSLTASLQPTDKGVDPQVSEAVGFRQAVCVVCAEPGVEVEEGAKPGQGEAVAAADEVELAGQEQVVDAFAERGASAYADQPCGGEV